MRRLLLAALLTLLVAACGGTAESPVVVQFVQPTPTAVVTAGLPSPTPEPVDVILSAGQVFQGGAILVSVTGPAESGVVLFRGRLRTLTRGDRSVFTFVGVSPDDPPGTHPIEVRFTTSNGTRGSFTSTVVVLENDWAVDTVVFDEDQQRLLDPSLVAAELATLQEFYGIFTEGKLWDGFWLVPTLGALTAPFGEQRAINGAAPVGHHGGTDIAAAEGADVVATNAGRVVMATALQLRGNMVIIDHGGGLLSGYAHLSEILVEAGQEVEAGDLIGRVGNTGLSTGAHLHWEVSAGGVLVDGVRFTDGTNGF